MHVAEKLQFYNAARASTGECRSLLYGVADNYAELAERAADVRSVCVRVGCLVTGLIHSTERRMK